MILRNVVGAESDPSLIQEVHWILLTQCASTPTLDPVKSYREKPFQWGSSASFAANSIELATSPDKPCALGFQGAFDMCRCSQIVQDFVSLIGHFLCCCYSKVGSNEASAAGAYLLRAPRKKNHVGHVVNGRAGRYWRREHSVRKIRSSMTSLYPLLANTMSNKVIYYQQPPLPFG